MSEEVTVTTLSFTISELVNSINNAVLYKTRNRDEKKGTGNSSIVDAEKLVKTYLKTVSSQIFSKWISPMSRKLSDLEEDYTPYEITDDEVIFKVVFPDKFDSNIKEPVLQGIEDCIVSYCVWKWMSDANLPGVDTFKQEYQDAMDDLIDMTTRRVNLKRTYKLY